MQNSVNSGSLTQTMYQTEKNIYNKFDHIYVYVSSVVSINIFYTHFCRNDELKDLFIKLVSTLQLVMMLQPAVTAMYKI